MRLSLRFIIPLVFILTVIAYSLAPLVDKLALQWFTRDVDIRADLIANTLHDGLLPLLEKENKAKTLALLNRITHDERLLAVGYCDQQSKLIYSSDLFPRTITCKTDPSEKAILDLPSGLVHFAIKPMGVGNLIIIHDMSFVGRRSETTKKYVLYLFIILAVLISFTTVLVAQLSWKGWVAGIRAIVKGEGLLRPISPPREFQPIVKDLRILVRDLEKGRKIRDESRLTWTPQTLKELLQKELTGDEVIIVSNREPYIHNKNNGKIEVQVPASGLVTALEPIMRACSGTWIAHGSGDADREVVDKNDHIRVPPEKPAYTIRRVWLTKEQEEGYYYGFSNEGIWPLCHIAHTRPVFRSEDWQKYYEVNQKFAKTVIEEAKSEDPVILVQDYHFALVPKMIREKLPKATIITFWHIPWPNPEAFGICPWREQILEGLLGSNIVGFHTQFHVNNFVDSIDRFLECRIDRETSTVSYKKKLTAVSAYPISIEWPPKAQSLEKSIPECRKQIREANAIDESCFLGIGVDRLDYTKGILERFRSIEKLLELHPDLIGKFTFIQIAAPTRSSIKEYQNFENDVRSLANQINRRFSRDGYHPIFLKVEHHDQKMVFEHFRGADLCMVTSLHDGMNLVAKEFISARDDERGVLILSQFAGASRELPEALIVNPYNIDQCAQALAAAISMPLDEQRERMHSMRSLIQEFNIYRWAGRMLIDAARIRQKQRLISRIKDSSEGEGYFL